MENCIFCKIINKEIPSDMVYEDDYVVAFNDINPIAPVHVLVIPKKHICSVIDIKSEEMGILCNIFDAVNKIVKKLGLEEKGFRVINNCGSDGGQTVMHIHFHILGGRPLTWTV